MRLMRIRPHYFRAFGNSDWVNLNSDLVLVFGPNGFGKTSLAEAVEWLLYGRTHRRRRGEELSQRDYQGSYRNAHAEEAETTFVECEVRLQDGTTRILRRDLFIGHRAVESSQTFMDGQGTDFPSILGTEDEVFYPIIAQHSLQDFIHSRPKDRRDKISAAFGLEPLVRYKTVLDRARDRFQSTPPAEVTAAGAELRRIAQAMISAPPLSPLRQKWGLSNPSIDCPQDAADLLHATQQFLQQGDIDWHRSVAQLTTRRTEEARRVFDTSPIVSPANYIENLVRFKSQSTRVHDRIEALSVALQALTSSTAAVYSQGQLQFWQMGLELGPAETSQCPMCESDTLPPPKRSELQERIDRSAGFTQSLATLREECRTSVTFVEEILRRARSLFPAFMNENQRESLLMLHEGNEELCTPYLEEHDRLRDAWREDERLMQDMVGEIRRIPTTAISAETVESAIAFVGRLENDTVTLMDRVSQTAELYSGTVTLFLPELEQRISSSEEVREIDAYLAPINGWRSVETIGVYNNLLAETLGLLRRIESHIQQKQIECFTTKGVEINRWYDMMNRGAQVRYTRMEPSTDSLQLIAESFGVEINAVSCLSQCQLNCLGLSVHFVRSLTSSTPFSFLLMDDPVQSMDDDHREALVIDVVNELLSIPNLQLIILSHVQGLMDSIWERYLHLQPLRLRISDFRREGPIIEEAETIQGCLNRARHLSQGNEDNRRLALGCLRRGVELMIRAVCRSTNSPSPPDDARARQMIPFFRSCTGTTAQQGNDLSNTIGFADPAPHTEVGWAVPTQPQILPHIDRVRTMAQRLAVS